MRVVDESWGSARNAEKGQQLKDQLKLATLLLRKETTGISGSVLKVARLLKHVLAAV